MNALLAIHVACGLVALLAGAAAIAAYKGGRTHRAAGLAFVAAMLVLGVTASVLGPFATPVQSPVGGLMVAYFVATGWVAAKRRGGRVDTFAKVAGVVAALIGAAIVAEGVRRSLAPAGTFVDPPRPGALLVMGTVVLLAALGDLRWWWRGTLAPRQRIARHLWRMCIAFFIATGSFFLGQMDVLPAPLRHLPTLLPLAFAPLMFLAYASLRHRMSGYPLVRKPRGPASVSGPRAPSV